MKNKIKHFSKGEFQFGKPEVIFPETNLVFKLGEGEKYNGSITIRNQADGNIRGLIYPSSYRIQCRELGFEGNPVIINFEYDGAGLLPGHVEQGKFTIVCNGGEYEIAFSAIIEKPFVMTSYGKVQNIEDFKRLAFKDFGEAKRLFRSRDFYEVLKYENERIRHLYDHMRRWSLNEQGLEEFLVGIKQKEKIFLTLNSDGKEFSELLEATKDSIIITKNTWGYLNIKVSIEGDFIRISQTQFSTDDFLGSTYELAYIIKENKLHMGNNYGQIMIETPYEKLTFDVEVAKDAVVDTHHRDIDIQSAQLIKSFLTYETRKMDIRTWADEADIILRELKAKAPGNEWFQLMQAHVYLLARKVDEAKWVLENFNYSRFSIGKNVEISTYYLFLTGLLKEDGTQVKRVIEEIQKVYMKNSHSWKLLCMLIELDPHYKDSYEKLHILERQFYKGANQVIFYLEAYQCFCKKSSNLKKLGSFEIHVLIFATKYKLMTKELALYTANLASQQKSFDPHLFNILVSSYKMYEEPMILTAICTLLIKGNQVENCYFEWYDKAVKSELKIAQLYEYYMASISVNSESEELPRTVYLYFMHGNSLDYQKCALLYENIVTYEDETSELYEHYREEIEAFAWEQLEKRHINSRLRIIYKRFCREKDLNAERMKALYDICCAYEVKTNSTNMKYVMVIEEDGEIHQRVPYTEDGALVFLQSREDRIVWESKDGKYYIDSIPYESKRLFYELQYIDMCKKHMSMLYPEKASEELEELNFEAIREKGMDAFEEQEVLRLCSKKIREDNYAEDDFLTFVSYALFTREQYDKIILTYLSNYYCGATRDMKDLWYIARDYEIYTYKLSERIVTQMLFSEVIFGDAEIFADYYEGGAYFRLKQAYLAYICREYVVKNRMIEQKIMNIICHEIQNGEELIDVSKIALLKYFEGRTCEHSMKPVLKKCMEELCEKQIYFPFYMRYEEEWLREFQIWDKTMVSYTANPESKVKISYQLKKTEDETTEYQTEPVLPMYENIYVKSFMLFEGEILKYYFKEVQDGQIVRTEKQHYKSARDKQHIGKYGRLNDIIQTKSGRNEKMYAYAMEEEMAKRMFVLYD